MPSGIFTEGGGDGQDNRRDSAAEEKAQNKQQEPSLKLFSSTLKHGRKKKTPVASPRVSIYDNISRPRPLLTMPNIFHAAMKTAPEKYQERIIADEAMRETPEFKRHEDATNIELFYDLFFVANLTTFTAVHEINVVDELRSYAGFFCILWFLWLQVSLFDVRFVQDSILERTGKFCQFGVMVGLAIVGPAFESNAKDQGVFQSLALILMISRVVLAFQYGGVLYEVWNYENTRIPLFLVVSTYLAAGMIYLGTYFGFKWHSPHNSAVIVWYVTAAVETAVNIVVSSKWKVLTFRGAHLIKRMSLLTLIILGEGIIAICKSIAEITAKEEVWSAPILVTIFSAVIVIYFGYMIYFDWTNNDHFGSFREGVWAFLHFPFHLALVLMVEGAAQFIVWRKVVEVVRYVNTLFTTIQAEFDGTDSRELAAALSNVTREVFTKYVPVFTHTVSHAQSALSNISNTELGSSEQLEQINILFDVIEDSIFEVFGIEPPEVEYLEQTTEWFKNHNAFKLIFVYFFISAGLTLVFMNALNFLSRTKPTRGDWGRMVVNSLIGVGLALLASIVNTQHGFHFAQSPWILPTVAMSFALVRLSTYSRVGMFMDKINCLRKRVGSKG